MAVVEEKLRKTERGELEIKERIGRAKIENEDSKALFIS